MPDIEQRELRQAIANITTAIAVIRKEVENLEALGRRRDAALEKLDDAVEELQLSNREQTQNWKLAVVVAGGIMTLAIGLIVAIAGGLFS